MNNMDTIIYTQGEREWPSTTTGWIWKTRMRVVHYSIYKLHDRRKKRKNEKLRQVSLVRGQVRGGKQKTKKKEEEEDYKEKEEKGI